jgi:hypothetical protein
MKEGDVTRPYEDTHNAAMLPAQALPRRFVMLQYVLGPYIFMFFLRAQK